MTIFIFGNPDVPGDSLPLRIMQGLVRGFPEHSFEIMDPNEEWEVPAELVIIDTAVGVKDVTVFHGLDKFVSAPSVGMHDFDALANLRYLQKLGRLKKVTIIGVPPEIGEEEALEKTVEALRSVGRSDLLEA